MWGKNWEKNNFVDFIEKIVRRSSSNISQQNEISPSSNGFFSRN
jgi:hypothetical protein